MLLVCEKTVQSIVQNYDGQKEYLLELLHDLQAHYKFIPQEALHYISQSMGVKKSQIYSLITFYKSFSLEPQGEIKIRVCMGTACHLKGAPQVGKEVQNMLKIKPGQSTPDGRYSLEEVNCVGACSLAPVVIIDDAYKGQVDREKIRHLLKES